MVWRSPLQRSVDQLCLVIVIVYAKAINGEITNKAIIVVYIKLWIVAYRIVQIINNFYLKLFLKDKNVTICEILPLPACLIFIISKG